MPEIIRIPLAAVLMLHGLIHLIGTAVYMQLTTLKDFPYKTTVLAGRLDLGVSGTSVFGLLWLVAGAGTALSVIGLLTRVPWAQPVLLAASVLSLVLCVMDWQVAKVGAILDLVILAAVLLAPFMAVRAS